MDKYLSESQIQEFLDSNETKYGFCARLGIHFRILKKSMEFYNIQFPKRNRIYKVGKEHPHWKGGRLIDKSGYILLYMPDHPNSNYAGYYREHRFVMEQKLGRILTSKEIVHHVNGIRSDNRIENLAVFVSNSEHLRHELKGKIPNWTEDGKRRIKEGQIGKTYHRRNLSQEDVYFYYVSCGWSIYAVSRHLNSSTSTVVSHLKKFLIHKDLKRACTRLTHLGAFQLKESPLASKAYETKCILFFSHLKKLLDIIDQPPSQKEYELWLKQVYPHSMLSRGIRK